jgi:hypothetical protein
VNSFNKVLLCIVDDEGCVDISVVCVTASYLALVIPNGGVCVLKSQYNS